MNQQRLTFVSIKLIVIFIALLAGCGIPHHSEHGYSFRSRYLQQYGYEISLDISCASSDLSARWDCDNPKLIVFVNFLDRARTKDQTLSIAKIEMSTSSQAPFIPIGSVMMDGGLKRTEIPLDISGPLPDTLYFRYKYVISDRSTGITLVERSRSLKAISYKQTYDWYETLNMYY